MEIMSKTDAINCALNEGLDALKKHLQTVADVANGGQLTATDQEFVKAAEEFMGNEASLAVARSFQQQINWDNKRIKDLEAEISRLNTRLAELEEEAEEC